jgi:hypothetical protein
MLKIGNLAPEQPRQQGRTELSHVIKNVAIEMSLLTDSKS